MIDAPEDERPVPAPIDVAAPAPVAARARSRAAGGFVVLLVVLLLVGALAFVAYRWLLAGRGEVQGQVAGVQATLQQQGQEAAALRDSLKTLEARLADANATNKILREEVLAMGERATLLEDAVGRLADNRMRGEVMLRLNEAEFLLLLGEERLRLFGDVPAALQAYTLADAALAGVDDPSLATLRQTLAQERLVLREVPADPRPALRAELTQLATTLPALPATREGEVRSTDANDSRLVRLLSGLVTVRRVSERDAVLGPVQRETTLAALRLQLELAQAALARPDVAAFQQALDAAATMAGQLFDTGDTRAAALIERLHALRATTLVPEIPALGATLQELRGLRATRSVGLDTVPALDATAPAETAPSEANPAAPVDDAAREANPAAPTDSAAREANPIAPADNAARAANPAAPAANTSTPADDASPDDGGATTPATPLPGVRG